MEEQTEKLFPSQEQEEKVLMVIRKHWFNYIIFFFLAALMLLPLAAFLIYWGANPNLMSNEMANITVIIMSIYVLLLLAFELYGFVNYYLDVYIITDRRIVDITQDGFFRRKISELHLRQVQDVSAKVNGIFQTILHFGDVLIQTAGERENFLFQSVPHPYTTSKLIINLHQHHIDDEKERPLPTEGSDNVYDKIETSAKQIIKDTPLREKIKNGGIFINQDKTISAATDLPEIGKNGMNTTIADSGILTEGKEVDLK